MVPRQAQPLLRRKGSGGRRSRWSLWFLYDRRKQAIPVLTGNGSFFDM